VGHLDLDALELVGERGPPIQQDQLGSAINSKSASTDSFSLSPGPWVGFGLISPPVKAEGPHAGEGKAKSGLARSQSLPKRSGHSSASTPWAPVTPTSAVSLAT
jgi:hypothetical protein